MKESSTFSEENSQIKPRKHSGSFFWPLFLITLGTLFLLNNFNILPWTIWDTLWRFWPLLLIIFGLEMIIGKGRMANFITTLIGLIVLITILAVNIPELGTWISQGIPQTSLQYFFKH